jgi:hypothetical protein
MFKYDTPEKIEALVRSFEDHTVSRDDWRHAEHLIVALYYVTRYDLDTATGRMRTGIHNLLTKGFGIDLNVEMPYHETLTVFWMQTVLAFSMAERHTSLPELAERLVKRFDKDYPLKFYDRDVLFSDAARKTFIDPPCQVAL